MRKHRQRLLNGVWVAVLVLAQLAPSARAQEELNRDLPSTAESGLSETTSRLEVDSDSSNGAQASKTEKRRRGLTYTALPTGNEKILDGQSPLTLAQFQTMEDQQRKIAAVAAACTVNVQIGNSQGCGVIITEDGYVLTAAHVAMRQGLDAVLTLADGKRVHGKTLGLNREVDAGLIKIEDDRRDDQPWPHATLGSSKNLSPGMWCIAMGHPGGYLRDRTAVMRVGRILAVRPGALVTDCALIGGDSGGPLFDLEGKLIGIHSRIGNDVADNLHVPIDHYDDSWGRLVASETWGFLPGFRPVIGVKGNNTGDTAEILEIVPESSADRAGLQPGDIVQSFGRVPITDFKSLIDAVKETMPGEQVLVKIRRGDTTLRVTLEIGRDPNS